MAKRKTVLPARRQRDRSRDDDSLLLRSAESLGRVIGALQRELDRAAKRLSVDPDRTTDHNGLTPRAKTKRTPPKKTGAKKTAKRTAKTKASAKATRTARMAAMAARKKAAGRASGSGKR